MEIQRLVKSKRMSGIVVHGNMIYLCGQVCEKSCKGIKDQTKDILTNIEELLESVGSNKSKILTVQIFLKDISYFNEMNEVWDQWVDLDHPPARACVQAALARPEWLLEMVVTAAR